MFAAWSVFVPWIVRHDAASLMACWLVRSVLRLGGRLRPVKLGLRPSSPRQQDFQQVSQEGGSLRALGEQEPHERDLVLPVGPLRPLSKAQPCEKAAASNNGDNRDTDNGNNLPMGEKVYNLVKESREAEETNQLYEADGDDEPARHPWRGSPYKLGKPWMPLQEGV
jgi:hypothetical protein